MVRFPYMKQASVSQRMKRILWNETGQMTIFVALIFQVLFVFFAMVINIGLLVHDKINLQNAVDFGAYYAAQRQAEILNEIAHVNYQIRQDNKLLAWRYHVLSTMGRDKAGLVPPPVRTPVASTFSPDDAVTEIPSVCVANFFWREMTAASTEDENYCFRQYGTAGAITRIQILPIIAPFVPGVLAGAATISALRNTQLTNLAASGPYNWAFAAQIEMAYRLSLANRKAVIQKLRSSLVSENMVDQSNQAVSQGVLNTIKKNLTVSNLSSFEDDQFKFVNGLASTACAGANKDGSPTISEMRTQPLLLFTYPVSGGTIPVEQKVLGLFKLSAAELAVVDPSNHLDAFTSEPSDTIGLEDPNAGGYTASSLGFEKNPWCMAYVGVVAKSKPRKPFAPLGQSVELEARAFAQPFGGRIGPWYRSQWNPGSKLTTGARVDPLTPPRLVNGTNDGGTTIGDSLPNYSRFPGDQLGMTSKVAQASTRPLMQFYGAKATGRQLSFLFYSDFENIPATGDPLAFDPTAPDKNAVTGLVQNVREAEKVAVSPDLFDAIYYSIDSHYTANYKILSNGGSRFTGMPSIFGQQIAVAPDIGGRNGTSISYEIADQISSAMGAGLDNTLRSSGLLNYFLSKPEHLLTGWAPNTVSNFDFPTARYGKCTHLVSKAQYMIPGGCTNGGRVGYSVRLISRSHLTGNWDGIGGEGQSGKILNLEGVSSVSN